MVLLFGTIFFMDSGPDTLWFISVQFGLTIVMFFLNFFADREPSQLDLALTNLENPCPELSASFPSKLTFTWVTSLIWKGLRNPLDVSMLWTLHPGISSRGIIPIFDSFFNPIIEAAKKNDKLTKASANKESTDAVKTKISVFPALLKTFGYEFFLGSFFQAIYALMNMISPQIQNLMINYAGEAGLGNEDAFLWKGILYAGLMLATTVFKSIINGQYFNKMFVIAMKVRTALNSAIYRKGIKLSSTARKESSVGAIVNLVSVDVQRFMVSIKRLRNFNIVC